MERVILKFSGEALKDEVNNVSEQKLAILYETIEILKKQKKKIAIVIGGGNFFRGRENTHMQEVNRDTIGMMFSVINALHIKDYLENKNCKCIVSSPFDLNGLINKYSDEEILAKYNDGEVIIFGGGLGKCGYSTDSGLVLANRILNSDLVIKLTKVDGIYNKDPLVYEDAFRYEEISYQDVIDNNYKVIDMYTVEELKNSGTEILVMNFNKYKELEDFFKGIKVGTRVYNEKR